MLNDVESYRKMILLKRDFETMKSMLEYVLRREKLLELKLRLQADWLESKKYECFDTSGLPRLSSNRNVKVNEMEGLMKLPKANFSSIAINKSKKKKKKRRLTSNLDASSVISTESVYSTTSNTETNAKDIKSTTIPNCIQYLPSRETFVTNWDHATPHTSNLIQGKDNPTYKFRHRPRLGRGGRVVIDRIPINTRHNVFIAGDGIYHHTKKNHGLLDLITPPTTFNDVSVQNKIEDIGLEEEEVMTMTRVDSSSNLSVVKEEESGQVVMVKVDDWMNAEDGHWGEEKIVFGPL